MSVRASVIVPVHNAASIIDGCLASLQRQTLDPAEYEVVVADDGSTDGTSARVQALVEQARARFVLVRLPENRGPAAARNAGLAAAAAPVIAFTDADCEVAPDWLARALARLDAEPDVAGVEGRTDPKGTVGTLTHQMRNESGGLFMTCNMIYRRAALERAGGFDERFRLAFLEDSDLAFGVQEGGGAIVFDPDVIVNHLVLHEGRRKFAREARKRFYNPLLYRKHPALYRRYLKPVVPGLPRLHLQYMFSVLAIIVFAALGLWGGVVLAALPAGLYFKRVAHAYRARDALSLLQVAVHPFVQTYWVIRGALHFRAFSFHI